MNNGTETLTADVRPTRIEETYSPPTSRGWAMDKKLVVGSLAVAGLMLLLFILDLVVGFPFGGSGPFTFIDIVGIIASGILLYMAFHAYRELR
jgi:hypothetical protein